MIENAKIKFMDNIDLLGFIFDKTLIWRPHLRDLKDEWLKRFNIIKILANSNWWLGSRDS